MAAEKIKLIGFDSETIISNHVHRFYSFQLFSNDFTYHNEKIRYFSKKASDFERFLTNKFNNAWFVTFNLAFDGIIISELVKGKGYNVSVVLAGSRIVRMTLRRGNLKWIFMDLRNLLPIGNLEKVSEITKTPKMKKPEFLGLREPETLAEKCYFRAYAMRDAEICYLAAKMLQDEFKCIKTTAAGLAIRVFKRDYVKFKKFQHYKLSVENRMRLTYHGGRTETFIRGINTEEIFAYDINSLYPYVMKTKRYPDVRHRAKYKTSVDLDNEGIAKVRVSCDHNYPPLAIKQVCADKTEKLIFPNGVFTGYFTYPELRCIEENNLGKILNVYQAYEYNFAFNPFQDFIQDFYAKKEKATLEESPKKTFYKIILNSTYGKFGEHGSCRFLTLDGSEILKENIAKPKTSWYHSVVLAAYITAYARLENWSYLQKADTEKMYYSDTDSFYTAENWLSKCNSSLGALKLEDRIKKGNAMFIRSKFYSANDKVVLKGFAIKMTPAELSLAIYKNNFERQEHRILKMLEAKRLGKIPLTDCNIIKKFSVESDGKRKFLKDLTPQELLVQKSLSIPLTLKG